MEFRHAADGNTAALRAWLRRYPERVNVPSPATRYTLLHTAVRGRHVATAQMLISEFNANMAIPCGGIGNTCLHVAASNGDVEMLSLLLSHNPVLKPNQLSEYPIDIAVSLPMCEARNNECAPLLRAYEERQRRANTQNPQLSPAPLSTMFFSSEIASCDAPCDRMIVGRHGDRSSSAQSSPSTADVVDVDDSDRSAGDRGAPVLRNEQRINEQGRLPLDIREFRHVYGNGFDFIEGSHAYQIRGLLPYNYKNNVYYTPVILILRRREDAGQQEERQSFSSTDSVNGPHTMSPYRAIIDRKKLSNLSINRHATYIDPSTGVIIPFGVDTCYGNLLDFVRFAVLDNFERVPPLTHSKNEKIAVMGDTPIFKLRPDGDEIFVRILRDLSTFCDGTFTYNSATRTVRGFLPLFLAAQTDAKAACDARPVLTGDVNALSSSSSLSRTAGSANVHSNRSRQDRRDERGGGGSVVGTHLALRLPLCMKFAAPGGFEEPPRVYFLNATTSNDATRANYAFLASIISDGPTGEVDRAALDALCAWRQHGSPLAVLCELQARATRLLVAFCKRPSPAPAGRESEGALGPAAQDVVAAARSPGPRVGGVDDSSLCVVCMEAVRSFVLLPCRHFLLCRQCSLHYKDRLGDNMLCPICRTPISEILEVFP